MERVNTNKRLVHGFQPLQASFKGEHAAALSLSLSLSRCRHLTLSVTILTVLSSDGMKAISLTWRLLGSAGEGKLQKFAPSGFCIYRCAGRESLAVATLPEDRNSVGMLRDVDW